MAGRVPPEVFAALADRAASLRGRATGRVLDLDTDPLDDADGVYDTIYAFLQAPHRRDLDRFYCRLCELLAPGGLVYALEPTIRTGPRGRALGIGVDVSLDRSPGCTSIATSRSRFVGRVSS